MILFATPQIIYKDRVSESTQSCSRPQTVIGAANDSVELQRLDTSN